MTLVVPTVGEVLAVQTFLNRTLYLGLYSNNLVPAEANTFGSLTEVAGGGYARKILTYANWTITGGDPTVALYPVQTYTFTGPTNAPGTIYGYFVIDENDVLCWLERFAESVLPYSPVADSVIQVTPRFQAS